MTTFDPLFVQQLSVEEHLQYLPIFLNLKYLRLNILFSRECMEAIAYMLKHMPDLEILVVHNELVMSCHETLSNQFNSFRYLVFV